MNKMKKIILSCLALLVCSVAQAQVPQQVNLQSLIYDFDGNVTDADSVDLTIRIVDQDLNELYSELHSGVPVINGAVSINIGETGASGEIPMSALDPETGPKMIDILVDDSTPMDLLPLSAVPYALYAQQAKTVAPDSIDSTNIKDGSIVIEDIDANIDFGPVEATDVTLEGSFDNFSGNTVQEAILGLDSTLTVHQNILNQLDATYVNASGDTMNGDLIVNGNISVSGTVDGVDISQFETDVSNTLANHETRITSLESDTQFSDINGQIGENQIPGALRPRAWVHYVRDLAGGGGYNILSSHNVSSISGLSGNVINLSVSLGNTNYAVIGTGTARTNTLPGATIQIVPFTASNNSGSQFTLGYPTSGPVESASVVVYSN